MDLFEAIQKRYSCRAYQDRAVEPEKMVQILEAARLAPSARNIQDWRFVVVTDAKTRQALQTAAANQAFVSQAPVVIAACSCTNKRMNLCGQPYSSINVAIAIEHIALAATALGLATCWIGSFKPHQVRRILNIPGSIEVVELMTLGYPADKGASPKRLATDQIACYEQWDF
jgi:nitroreductase